MIGNTKPELISLGLRTLDNVEAGQFIDLYLGEVITSKMADSRQGDEKRPAKSYFFTLDWRGDDDYNDYDEDENAGAYVVDGQKYGSATRFMNHSCAPNCIMKPVSHDHGDSLSIYDLAFFSIKKIPAGGELTFDYNPGWKGSKKVDPNAVRCLCGHEKCRGQLWPSSRKSAKVDRANL